MARTRFVNASSRLAVDLHHHSLPFFHPPPELLVHDAQFREIKSLPFARRPIPAHSRVRPRSLDEARTIPDAPADVDFVAEHGAQRSRTPACILLPCPRS